MSIASEISRLQSAKADMKTAIEEKGVTVSSSTKLDGYATLISQISGGGGGSSIGDLTAYQQVKVTPSDSGALVFTHTLEKKPKIVIVSVPNPDTPGANRIIHMVLDEIVGGVRHYNSGGTALTYNGCIYDDTLSNSRYKFTTTGGEIRRLTAAIVFETSTEYTIDIYA